MDRIRELYPQGGSRKMPNWETLLRRYSDRSGPYYALFREKSKTPQVALVAPAANASMRIAVIDLKDLIDVAAVKRTRSELPTVLSPRGLHAV